MAAAGYSLNRSESERAAGLTGMSKIRMKRDRAVVLIAESVAFLSDGDERSFFGWVESVPGVKSVQGRGRALLITFAGKRLPDESLREVIALFFRYGVEMTQLADLLTEGNRAWFANPKAYWYRNVFKGRVRARRADAD